jgi:hypothetical protein
MERDSIAFTFRAPDAEYLAAQPSPPPDRPCPGRRAGIDLRLAAPGRPAKVFGGNTPARLHFEGLEARYICNPRRCVAAFPHASSMATLSWSPQAIATPAPIVVRDVATQLAWWTYRDAAAPPASAAALASAREDLESADQKGDRRPIANREVDPEGGWVWTIDGFQCRQGRGDFRRLPAEELNELGPNARGYVFEYNRVLSVKLGCRTPPDEVLPSGFSEDTGHARAPPAER